MYCENPACGKTWDSLASRGLVSCPYCGLEQPQRPNPKSSGSKRKPRWKDVSPTDPLFEEAS